MRDEGVIKFECAWTPGPLPDYAKSGDLFDFRNQLYRDGLIGVYPDGIGFGNISVRLSDSQPTQNQSPQNQPQFLISASQTGQIPSADAQHFALVTSFDLQRNSVSCVGPMKASSESMTHAIIYETFPQSSAVIHVHSNTHWQRLLGVVPTTVPHVPYGTPEMAAEVQRLARQADLSHQCILVMAGHEDGILSFGASLSAAYAVLKRWGLAEAP